MPTLLQLRRGHGGGLVLIKLIEHRFPVRQILYLNKCILDRVALWMVTRKLDAEFSHQTTSRTLAVEIH